jgi:hypothetical protein
MGFGPFERHGEQQTRLQQGLHGGHGLQHGWQLGRQLDSQLLWQVSTQERWQPLPRMARPSLSLMTCMLPMPMLARAVSETAAVRSAAEALATMPATKINAAQMIPKFFIASLPKEKVRCNPLRKVNPFRVSRSA